jgi:putative transposase of IS4/5 family DUF4096
MNEKEVESEEELSPMKPYASDLSDAERTILEPLIPPAKPGGRPRSVNMRQILNGIFYVLQLFTWKSEGAQHGTSYR